MPETRRLNPPARAFLATSVVAHAALLALLPGFPSDRAAPPVELEVTLVQPEPLPMRAPEPEVVVKPPPRKPELQRRPAAKRAAPVQPERPPVLALPARAPQENTFTVPLPSAPEAHAGEQAPQAQVAGIAVTPPAVGAAYLRNPPPPYPAAARRNGVQGTVMLKVVVTSEGLPARVEVGKSSGSFHLDNAALEAVKAWRFVPARRGTEPIEGIVTFPMVFRLDSAS